MSILTVITVYTATLGAPLYCDGWDTDLLYSPMTQPWVAMPAAWYENGGHCGDRVGIKAAGELRYFSVLDRIAPGDWYVVQPDGEHLPIGADVPERFWWGGDDLSVVGEAVWSVEDLRERWEAYR